MESENIFGAWISHGINRTLASASVLAQSSIINKALDMGGGEDNSRETVMSFFISQQYCSGLII